MGGEAVILFIKLTKNGHFPDDFLNGSVCCLNFANFRGFCVRYWKIGSYEYRAKFDITI